jgi:hypothetical protein
VNLFKENYKEIFPFPDRSITPEKKTSRAYSKSVAEAIYSRFLKNKTAVSSSTRTLYQELRDYGKGEQSEDKYKRYLMGVAQQDASQPITSVDGSWTENRSQERKGWMNVLWEILSPATMINNMIHGLFDDIDFDIMADAVDADSGAEEENEKWKLWVTTKSFVAERLVAARAMAGVPPERPEFIPESIEELELYKEAGGFKMAYAMEMEKLLRHTSDTSNWEELKRKILDDIVDLSRAFVKADYNKETSKIEWRYVDPDDIVIQYSKYLDFRDSEYAGEFKEIKISDLRKDMLNEGYKEDDIKEVAETYCGVFGNPSKDNFTDYKKRRSGAWRYDNFTVIVFKYEWIDTDVEKKVKYTNTYGKTRFKPYEEKKLRKKEKLVEDTKKFLYKGTWVIGTDIAFDYGKEYYQPRPQPKEVELTYKGFIIPKKSLTAQLLPIYDNIQIGWLKYQNALAQIFEAGYTVDYRMLQNISDGERKYSPAQVLKMWKETGILLYMSTPIGQFYRGGSTQVVSRLEGGMGQALQEALGRIQLQFMLIEKMTGFSPVALGATPNPDAPVTTTERSLQATHNSLKPMIRGLFELKNQLAKATSTRLQQMLKYDEDSKKEFTKVIGEGGVQSINMAKDSAVEYGVRLRARPTNQEKLNLLKAAEAAMQPGRDGLPGISFDDYTYIVERLNAGGNIKEIRLYLSQARRKAEKRNFEEKQTLQQQQIQGNQMLAEQKMKQTAMENDMKVRGEIAINNNKAASDLRLKMVEINGDYMTQLTKAAAEEENAPQG